MRKRIRSSVYILYYLLILLIYSVEIPFNFINLLLSPLDLIEVEWLENLLMIPVSILLFIILLGSFILPLLYQSRINNWLNLQVKASLKDHTKMLDETKNQLESIIDISEKLRDEIETQWQENEELRRENEILLSTRNDSTADLMNKLKAIEAVSKKKRKRELIMAFILGISSSLVAAYLFDLFRLTLFAKNLTQH